MRKQFAVGVVPVLVLFLAMPALALEKTTMRAIDRGDDWNASNSGITTISYYNICTGWVWIWSGWSPGETMGTNFLIPPCPAGPFLTASWALTFSGVPSGYGFTGTIAAVGGTDCAAPVLASQPFLPPSTPSWAPAIWGGIAVSQRLSILISWQAAAGFTNPTGLASDHPLYGPTGPDACGSCFPTTRVANSRYYGVGGAYCPSGTTLSDGLCDIEWLMSVSLKCTIGVEEESWGQIKNLYR